MTAVLCGSSNDQLLNSHSKTPNNVTIHIAANASARTMMTADTKYTVATVCVRKPRNVIETVIRKIPNRIRIKMNNSFMTVLHDGAGCVFFLEQIAEVGIMFLVLHGRHHKPQGI